jgi:tetratricopeptide (TPR) repeat protein
MVEHPSDSCTISITFLAKEMRNAGCSTYAIQKVIASVGGLTDEQARLVVEGRLVLSEKSSPAQALPSSEVAGKASTQSSTQPPTATPNEVAAKNVKKAWAIELDMAKLFAGLGEAQKKRDWQQSKEILERMIEIETDDFRKARHYSLLAVIAKEHFPDPSQCAEFWDIALDLDPNFVSCFEHIVKFFTEMKDWKRLERSYRKMLHRISIVPKSEALQLVLWQGLGQIHQHRFGDLVAAKECCKMAMRLDPSNKQLQQWFRQLPLA